MILGNKNNNKCKNTNTSKSNKNKSKKVNTNNINKYLNSNIIRKYLRIINDYLDYTNFIPGELYYLGHRLMAIGVIIILLFTNNIFYLICTLIIMTFDAISIVMLHDCPITIIERKYLEATCSSDELTYFFQNAGINYNCDCRYEKAIEGVVTSCFACILKIIIIIILNTFSVKLNH